MNQFYIYSFNYNKELPNSREHEDQEIEIKRTSATVIFCENDHNMISNLQSEIKTFYETNAQTDEIFVFGGEDLRNSLLLAFDAKTNETFRHIPTARIDHLIDNLFVFTYDEKGVWSLIKGSCDIKKETYHGMFNEGLQKIFQKRGGLIESKEAHHYVFPSGKHCDKFLRTGNILLHSSEIFFIAFNLLKYFDTDRHNQIFCDTSSINSLAFTLQELKRRLTKAIHNKDIKTKPVESFSSYEGIIKADGKRLESSLILISASTSSNIIQRIIAEHPIVEENDIQILYFLGPEEAYHQKKAHIICNLTYDDEINPNGIPLYPTYTSSNCHLCDNGSHPVKINGDIMLPESPKINRIILGKKDAPANMGRFSQEFSAFEKDKDNIIKVNYKEGPQRDLQYELYFDIHHVLDALIKGKTQYKAFKAKLDDYINQYIPANVKFLICLPDEGSLLMADYILSRIKENIAQGKEPVKVKFKDVDKIIPPKEEDAAKVEGSAVIIGSCISNGKNLLYLSRSLRSMDKLKLIYFIGLCRTSSEQQLEFLKSNLTQGIYGKESNSFHTVENFYFTNEVKNTSWLREIEFLKQFSDFLEFHTSEELDLKPISLWVDQRTDILNNSMSSTQKGLANNLFYPSVFDNKELKLRKNYAFLAYPKYHVNLSQADVYFTISSILNRLRNVREGNNLKQSEYVRNLLDPNNFNRFNDGIIQASLLRAAHVNEISYHIDVELSLEMKGILETLISNYNSEQGEALLEFLYALASKKMTLQPAHLTGICQTVHKEVKDLMAIAITLYIQVEVLKDYNKQKSLFEENILLKKQLSECLKATAPTQV